MPDNDFSELTELALDLGEIPLKMIPFTRKAVEVTARNVKDDWQKSAARASGQSLADYARSIDYDMKLDTDGEIGAEVGPNPAKKQGTFGIVDDAPGGVRSRPQHAGDDALKKNLRDFEEGIAQAALDAFAPRSAS